MAAQKRRAWRIVLTCALMAAPAVSLAFNVWGAAFAPQRIGSFLQTTEQIDLTQAGVLRRNERFADGEDIVFAYDFDHPDYQILRQKYDIAGIAGSGTQTQRALRLMNAFSGRLSHESNFTFNVPMNAVSLLSYSLNNKAHGINCRAKAQILNEMCLALGIYARKVWLLPYSMYDDDCHVVNEVWDDTLSQWVMLDITNNEYWVDDGGAPLSVQDIRTRGANRDFCTPVKFGDSLSDLAALKQRYTADYLYIMKNMVYMKYLPVYTSGEGEPYALTPTGIAGDYAQRVSLQAVLRAPHTTK